VRYWLGFVGIKDGAALIPNAFLRKVNLWIDVGLHDNNVHVKGDDLVPRRVVQVPGRRLCAFSPSLRLVPETDLEVLPCDDVSQITCRACGPLPRTAAAADLNCAGGQIQGYPCCKGLGLQTGTDLPLSNCWLQATFKANVAVALTISQSEYVGVLAGSAVDAHAASSASGYLEFARAARCGQTET
jgi:hypothetical protein